MTPDGRRAVAVVAALALLASALGVAAAGSDLAQSETRHAELSIEQPHYVDEAVETDRTENRTTYFVRGGVLEIEPLNFNNSDAVDFGVEQNGASLRWDDSDTEYVLDTGEQDGTFVVYWVVNEQVVVDVSDGNETGQNGTGGNATDRRLVTQKVRYEAHISVEGATFVHLAPDEHAALKEDAANWSEVVATFGPIGADSTPIDAKLQTAANWFQWSVNPIAALEGDWKATFLMLTFTNGGRLMLVMLLVVPLAVVAPTLIRYRRLKRRVPEMDAIEQEKARVWAQKRKKLLVETTPYDLPVDGRTASKLETHFGSNLWQVANSIFGRIGDAAIKRVFLQAMGAAGYRARYTTDADGDPTDVTLVGPDDDPDGEFASDGGDAEVPTDDLSDPGDDLVAAVSWDDVDPATLSEDVPLSAIDAPIRATDVDDDLVADLGVEFPEDFRDRRHFADCLGEVMTYVLGHSYTDEDGRIREEQSLVNLLAVLSTVTAERYDVPQVRYYRDLFVYLANSFSGNERLREAADETGFGADPTGNGGGGGDDDDSGGFLGVGPGAD